MSDTKKTVPAAVREEEGSRIRALVDQLAGGAMGKFAKDSGIGTPAYLTQLMSGHRPLNVEVAVKIASALSVPIDRFSPRIAQIVRAAASCVSAAGNGISTPTVLIAREPAASIRPKEWPLKVVDYDGFVALPRDVLDKIEGAILVLRPPSGNGKARRA